MDGSTPPKNAYSRHFSNFATKCVIIDQEYEIHFLIYLLPKKDYNLPFSFQDCNIVMNFEVLWGNGRSPEKKHLFALPELPLPTPSPILGNFYNFKRQNSRLGSQLRTNNTLYTTQYTMHIRGGHAVADFSVSGLKWNMWKPQIPHAHL